MSEFIRVVWVKATRKARRCDWCRETIRLGSPAEVYAGKGGGYDFCTTHMHPECAAAKDVIASRHGEWEANGDYARGRTDDRGNLPPEFLPTYRGQNLDDHRTKEQP